MRSHWCCRKGSELISDVLRSGLETGTEEVVYPRGKITGDSGRDGIKSQTTTVVRQAAD
ncbi:MAG: hypothetical protein VB878_04710 [Pirellulaceae bacterium]